MAKAPPDDIVEKLWRMPLNERVPLLTVSIIESNSKDLTAIAKTFISVIKGMAQLQGSAARFTFADLLHKAANELEQPVSVKLHE